MWLSPSLDVYLLRSTLPLLPHCHRGHLHLLRYRRYLHRILHHGRPSNLWVWYLTPSTLPSAHQSTKVQATQVHLHHLHHTWNPLHHRSSRNLLHFCICSQAPVQKVSFAETRLTSREGIILKISSRLYSAVEQTGLPARSKFSSCFNPLYRISSKSMFRDIVCKRDVFVNTYEYFEFINSCNLVVAKTKTNNALVFQELT